MSWGRQNLSKIKLLQRKFVILIFLSLITRLMLRTQILRRCIWVIIIIIITAIIIIQTKQTTHQNMFTIELVISCNNAADKMNIRYIQTS